MGKDPVRDGFPVGALPKNGPAERPYSSIWDSRWPFWLPGSSGRCTASLDASWPISRSVRIDQILWNDADFGRWRLSDVASLRTEGRHRSGERIVFHPFFPQERMRRRRPLESFKREIKGYAVGA